MDTDEFYARLIADVLAGHKLTTRNASVSRCTTYGWRHRFFATPLVSARKTAWKAALREWEWFMSGSHNINDLPPSVRPWWEPWANQYGSIYFNYSEQFRHFTKLDLDTGFVGGFDQVEYLIAGICEHPNSRRNVITTWNTAEMADPHCPITNCHGTVIQAFVESDNSLHLLMYQRSADVIVGLPANWIQYWAFLLWLAHRTGRKVGSFIWVGGDVHIYDTHTDLARRIAHAACACARVPELVYTPSSEDFRADDFSLNGLYTPVLTERAEMIV